jgi:hypothetical protein
MRNSVNKLLKKIENFYADSPRQVRKLIAECPHSDIGVLSRRYADPLKYASRGSTLNELTVSEFIVTRNAIRETGKLSVRNEKKKILKNLGLHILNRHQNVVAL